MLLQWCPLHLRLHRCRLSLRLQMSSGGEDDSETSSAGEHEMEWWWSLVFGFLYVVIGLSIMATLAYIPRRGNYFRRQPRTPSPVPHWTCTKIVVGMLWPLMLGPVPLLTILIVLVQLYRLIYILHRRLRARQVASRLRNKSRSWENRGWLVMLRVRYLRSLAQTQNTHWRPPFRTGRKGQTNRRPFKLDVISGAHAAVGDEQQTRLGQMGREEDVERGKVSWFDLDFAKVVAHITEIGEEGLFREVISFI
ncbi:unnamed protein product [Scytosiphon promiscuus]